MRKQKRRNAIAGGWVSYQRSMVASPALRVLSQGAVRVMHRLEDEHMAHGGAENGRLIVTHDQFVEWGVHHNAVAPAIRELVALGFVEITEKGCAGNENHRRATKYRLTYVNSKSREQPTHEWSRIMTIDEAERIATVARAAKDTRSVALGRRLKNKSPLPKTGSDTATENRYRNPKSPLPKTGSTAVPPKPVPLSIISGAQRSVGPQADDAPTAPVSPPDTMTPTNPLLANLTKLPRSPPRLVAITPKIDMSLNWTIAPHRQAPLDALTVLEALILSNALPDGAVARDVVHEAPSRTIGDQVRLTLRVGRRASLTEPWRNNSAKFAAFAT
jgi:hypothetical protein